MILDDIQLTPRRSGLHDQPSALPSLRCYKGSKASTATNVYDERIAASDEAVALRGDGNVVDRSVNYTVTDGGAVSANERVSLAALQAATGLGGGAFGLVSDIGGKLIESVGAARERDQAMVAQANASAGEALRAATTLAETKATDGDSLRQRTFLYVAGGVVVAAVAMGAIVLRKR